MRDHMKEANLPEPEFSQQEVGSYQVHVTLRNNIEHRKEFVEAGALKLIGESVYEDLSNEEKQIINFVAEHGRMNISDASRILHKDWQTTRKIVESLAERKILLKRTTGKQRDPSAHFVLRRKSPDR